MKLDGNVIANKIFLEQITMKKIILVFIMASLLLIVGCNLGSKGKNPITDVDVRKGTDGLKMEFVKNAPPLKVFEDDVFPIAINLKNRGAFDIKPTTIMITETLYGDECPDGIKCEIETTKDVAGTLVFGIETANVELVNEDDEGGIAFILDGKSIFNPNGDEELLTLDARSRRIGAQSETQPSTILATACYPYKTIFGASVCIDTDIYDNRRGEKACSISDLIFSGGQGAPVAITKIETRMLPQDDKVKPHFLIYIKNQGNGEVVNLNEVENVCKGEPLKYTDVNTITIMASLSGKPLQCGINNDPGPAVIRLKDKEKMIRCTLEPKEGEIELIDINKDAYVTPLSIELDYGYTFTISKDIIIEKILTY